MGRFRLTRRRAAGLAVAGVVLLLHVWVTREVSESLVGASGRSAPPQQQRLEVAFVRELMPTAPAPAVARPAPPPRPRRAAPRPAPAASAPEPEASAPEPEASAAADVVEPAPAASVPAAETVAEAAAAAEPAPAAAASAAAPASAPAFEWPPSTRLDYTLTGHYRGEVQGSARVQWIRLGLRYQVHVDVQVGPSFAPLVQRRMTSDGELTEAGLAPRSYDEETRSMFGSPRRNAVRFEQDRIVLANGREAEPQPGVQDTASQFVQLTWLFITRPELLRVGGQVDFALALPRRVDRWVYDILAEEALHTPIGEIGTFHLRPRRESARSNELTAELWFAPSLQYLPVRIRIRQNEENYVDLVIRSRPLQTEGR